MKKLPIHLNLEDFKSLYHNTLGEHLGIEFTEIGEDYLIAKMPVDPRTHQPLGFLHGGASVVLAETLGSFGSMLLIDTEKFHVMGTEVSASHLRSVRSGYVFAKAQLKHCGKTSHAWHIEITNQAQELICLSRLTVRVLEHQNKG